MRQPGARSGTGGTQCAQDLSESSKPEAREMEAVVQDLKDRFVLKPNCHCGLCLLNNPSRRSVPACTLQQP